MHADTQGGPGSVVCLGERRQARRSGFAGKTHACEGALTRGLRECFVAPRPRSGVRSIVIFIATDPSVVPAAAYKQTEPVSFINQRRCCLLCASASLLRCLHCRLAGCRLALSNSLVDVKNWNELCQYASTSWQLALPSMINFVVMSAHGASAGARSRPQATPHRHAFAWATRT